MQQLAELGRGTQKARNPPMLCTTQLAGQVSCPLTTPTRHSLLKGQAPVVICDRG